MTDLSQFSASEFELLVSLPHRAGIFISFADDLDGEDDDERELKMLETTLKAIAGLHKDKPLLAAIFKETLRLKSEWARWETKAFNISDDARAAISLLKSKAGEGAAKQYRAALMEVATTVAQAYGEFGQFDDADKNAGGFSALVSKVVSGFSGLGTEDKNHPMNVSASEESALSELSAALKV
jgi:hypothetical protein